MYVLNAVRRSTVQTKPVASMPLPSVTPGKWMAQVSYFCASGTWSLLLSPASRWAGLGTWTAPTQLWCLELRGKNGAQQGGPSPLNLKQSEGLSSRTENELSQRLPVLRSHRATSLLEMEPRVKL